MFQIVLGVVSTVNSALVCVNRDIQSSLTLSRGLNTSSTDRACGGLWVIRSKHKLDTQRMRL